MKVVAINAFNDVPQVMTRQTPSIGPHDVLIRMSYASLNPIDSRIASGFLDGRMEHRFPLILGMDGAGVIEAIGSEVSRFKPGDRVCGRFVHDHVGNGSFAEFVSMSEDATLALVPPNVPLELAAALPTAGGTALQSVELLGSKAGGVLLIVGASGGVGSFAVQLARSRGWKIVASAPRDSAAWLRSVGVERVLEKGSRLLDQLYEYCPTGIDGLIDLVDPAPGFADLVTLIAPGGVAVSTVWAAEPQQADALGVRAINLEMKPRVADLDMLLQQVGDGFLDVLIDRRIDLSSVPDVMLMRGSHPSRGKTLIQLSGPS